VFVLFALGHTYGFLSFRPSSARGFAVYESMNSVHLVESDRSYTYGGFYRGVGLSATISMLFWAFLCWYLGELARKNRAAIGALGWALLAVQVAGAVLGFLYFGPPAMVLSLLVALLVGMAAWLAHGEQQPADTSVRER
jgi:fatty acid desaturase